MKLTDLTVVRVGAHHYAIWNERTNTLLTSYDPFTGEYETELCGSIGEAKRYIADVTAKQVALTAKPRFYAKHSHNGKYGIVDRDTRK